MKLITAGLGRYYHSMQKKYPNILWFGNETRREIAITFDDGPHPKDTSQVLDMLAKLGIQGTFFLVGKYAEQYPQLVKQIYQSGHQLGIHCYRHLPFPLENSVTLRDQLDRTRDLVANICGISPNRLKYVRPPYGAFTSKTLTCLNEWGYLPVLWNNIPPHWMQPLQWSIQQILDQIHNGSIIVLHDGHEHGAKVTHILEFVIPKLEAQGYDFVTIEEMKRT